MPQRTTRRRVATIDYQANSVVRTELPISGKVRRLFLELTGVFDHTADSNVAVNGNPGSIIPNITVYLDREEVLKQGPWSSWRNRMYAHYKLPAEVPYVDADVTLFSRIQIPFITPLGARPVDTVLDMDAHQRLDIEVQWLDDTAIDSSGSSAWTTEPHIDVIAEISRFDPPPIGMYKELMFTSDALGTAANANLELELVTGPRKQYHHVMLAATDDAGQGAGPGLVATALNAVSIQQTGAGEQSVPFGIMSGVELQHDFDEVFRTVDGVQAGLYYIGFQGPFDGRATYNLDTAGLDDLRLRIDHAGFTTAGRISVYYGLFEPFNL